jgi:transposase
VLARNPAVDLWAIDEVHFQQHGSRGRMWIPPEVADPVVLHHPTRKSVGYFGAVRLRDGKFLFSREATCFDGMTTWSFLRKLRQGSRRSGRRVVVITDNAKYHHAKLHADWRKEQQAEFTLSYLPPYSPDLNPIERVWKLTRRLCLHNCYFPTLDDVVQAVEEQFAAWVEPNDALRRLCTVA